MLFDDWPGPARTLTVAVLAFVCVVVLLRLTGKRTLTKWNAFDFVVTIALGSSLATMILSNQVTLAQGLTAFASLVLLQFAVTWLSVRVRWLQRVIKAEPALLVCHGRFERDTMRRERVTESEVRAAVRATGEGRVESVAAVVLETDGAISVIRELDGGGAASALADVPGWDTAQRRSAS